MGEAGIARGESWEIERWLAGASAHWHTTRLWMDLSLFGQSRRCRGAASCRSFRSWPLGRRSGRVPALPYPPPRSFEYTARPRPFGQFTAEPYSREPSEPQILLGTAANQSRNCHQARSLRWVVREKSRATLYHRSRYNIIVHFDKGG